MKKLLSIILSITMLLTMSTIVFADGIDGPMQPAKIKVGICADFKPFEYYDENGNLTGFDVDLMNYIGERIGFEIEYVDMSFDQLFSAVMGGDVACAISGIAITEERKNVIDYTIPYLSAKVTYSDGETSDTSIEQYAIIFPNNSVEKAKVLESTGEIAIYNLVNDALIALIEDKTVEKLGEKYNLNKAADTDDFDYEYTMVSVPTDLPNDENDTSTERDVLAGTTTIAAPSDWAKYSVDIADKLGVFDFGDNFNFSAPITRELFCDIAVKMFEKTGCVFEIDSLTRPLAVVDTDNENIKKLYESGIILGKEHKKTGVIFAPNDTLTREEAATIILRLINKFFPMPATEMWFEYDDIEEISEWASDSIQTISNMGIMTGVGNNRFAPKDTYTTEQAIVTLVRVLENAGAAGLLDVGIIGGADGPTSIIVGDNVNVIEQEDYDNFYAEVTKNTTKVDDFYVDEAIKLITESGKLAADKDFVSLYTTNDEMTNKLLALGAVDFNKPTDIFYLSSNREQIKANIEALAEAEGVDIEDMGDFWFEHILKRLNFSTLASLINASYGAENLAALTILTNSRGYIMPKDFKDDFALFIQYEGDYSAIVSFSEFGDGVISANMSFAKNGDKDNVFRRMYEITSVVGEDGITIANVK